MARLKFGKDSLGKEILELVSEQGAPADPTDVRTLAEKPSVDSRPYKGENTIVMMEWERPYMRALVDALGVKGVLL